MANTRFSDLAAGAAIADADLFPVVQTVGVGAVKVTFTQVKEWVQDVMNATLVGGSNISITYNDPAGTLTFDFTGGAPLFAADIGVTVQGYDADLAALAALSSTGLLARTGAGTVAARTLTGPAAGISVSNGDGVSGNPTLALANDLAALEGLGSTGFAVRTASDTWAQRSIAAGGGGSIAISNGDGVSGNPTISRAALTGDVTASADSNATTIANNAVTYAKVQQASAGFTILAKATTGAGNYAELAAGSDGVLRRSGSGDLAFGTLVTGNIGNSQVTNAKLADMTAATFKGRNTGTGAPEDLTAAQVSSLLGIAGLEVVTSNRTYYVRTDGSDSNDGLTDSAGGAFLTVQKAIDVIYGKVLSGGVTVTIKVGGSQSGARTFTGDVVLFGPWIGGGNVTIEGDTTTPSNRIIEGSTRACIWARQGARVSVRGIKFQTTGTASSGLEANAFSRIDITGLCDFGACAARHMFAVINSAIELDGVNYNITGGAIQHIWATTSSRARTVNGTVTLTGTPAFTTFAQCDTGASVATNMTYSGSATGVRYNVSYHSTINTSGGGATFLPGNSAGTADAATYGLYV